MMEISTLIIGAGKIAAGLDSPVTDAVLTHAHAYQQNTKTKLLGFFDSNPEAAISAAQKWGGDPFFDLEKTLAKHRPEIISICTPPSTRLGIIKNILKYPPKVIFLEKPLASNLEEAKEIVSLITEASIPCLVNYSRRFDLTMQRLSSRIKSNQFGTFQTGAIFYAKGIKNNGSHLINLMQFLVGDIASYDVTGGLADFSEDDYSLEMKLNFSAGGAVHFHPLNENNYSVIEILLYFESAKIHIRQFGLQYAICEKRADPVFQGYYDLDDQAPFLRTEYEQAFSQAVKNIVDHIENKTEMVSSLEEAFVTEKNVHDIYSTFLFNKARATGK